MALCWNCSSCLGLQYKTSWKLRYCIQLVPRVRHLSKNMVAPHVIILQVSDAVCEQHFPTEPEPHSPNDGHFLLVPWYFGGKVSMIRGDGGAGVS